MAIPPSPLCVLEVLDSDVRSAYEIPLPAPCSPRLPGRRRINQPFHGVVAMNAVSIDRKNFIAYPTNRVVGTIRDADHARAAIDALLQAGFARENIDILHNEEDLHRLD